MAKVAAPVEADRHAATAWPHFLQFASPPRILVVEDSATALHALLSMLPTPDYACVTASTMAEAFARLEGDAFDVVLLDFHLPDGTGLDILRRLRIDRTPVQTPVIMVTTAGDAETITTCLKAGANDYVCKPYHREELQLRVANNARIGQTGRRLEETSHIIFMVAKLLEMHDYETGDHCLRLAETGVRFGRILSLDATALEALQMAALLHDIGKIGIPDSILRAGRALTEEEWKVMKTHPQLGFEICREITSVSQILPIIRHHHEHYDGSGYPDGLAGEAIPLLARVFQLVDVFDALRYARPYKRGMSLSEIAEIFRAECDRGWRDPRLTGIFLENIDAIAGES